MYHKYSMENSLEICNKIELFKLFAILDIRNFIIDDFNPDQKFIILWKMKIPPYPIYVRNNFCIIAADVVLSLKEDKYIKGLKTDSSNAFDALNNINAEILSKEQAKDYVVSLLNKGYIIVSNSCLEHDQAKYFLNIDMLKIVSS